MKIHATLFAAVIALSSTTASANELRAFNKFDAAQKVADILMKIAPNERSFFVREFRGTATNNVGLSKLVGDRLAKAGVEVIAGASTEVEGRLFRLPRDESKELTGFTIQGTVYLTGGKERRFSVNVLNRDDAHTVVGETGETSPPPMAGPGSRPVIDATIVGTEVRPSPSSPYGVEILVETSPGQYRSLKPRHDGKLIKVDLKQGDIYAVRLHNRSDYEAAVEVSIDGLSRFSLSDDQAQSNSRDLIGKQGSRTIPGYYRTNEVVDAFQIGEYSKSVAAKTLPNPSDIGTVTVTFAAAWERGQKPPPNEPPATKSVRSLGTTQGPKRADPTVSVERIIGRLRAVVKVRY